jgi:hypothetical protein
MTGRLNKDSKLLLFEDLPQSNLVIITNLTG